MAPIGRKLRIADPGKAENIFLGDVSLLRVRRARKKKTDNRRNHVSCTHQALSRRTEIKSTAKKRLPVFCFS
jgi:hypothetical protein